MSAAHSVELVLLVVAAAVAAGLWIEAADYRQWDERQRALIRELQFIDDISPKRATPAVRPPLLSRRGQARGGNAHQRRIARRALVRATILPMVRTTAGGARTGRVSDPTRPASKDDSHAA